MTFDPVNGGAAPLQVTLNGITPAALVVVPGTTNLYIVGGSKVYRVSAATGELIRSRDAGTSTVKICKV